MTRIPFRSLCLALLVATTALSTTAATREETFRDLRISVRGEGRPVMMIPGLNSAASVWDETCDALQPAKVQCHIVQLPGFTGTPPVAGDTFLAPMRDRLLAYLAKLDAPAVVMGHSLGGNLALQMALEEPARIDRLVIVDSLPFFPAAGDPKATAESMNARAAAMRKGMRDSPAEAYNAQLKGALRGMTRDPKKVERLEAWGLASDRATTTQAMYELFTVDLRGELGAIRKPVLVLGAWAAYAGFGATRESTRRVFEDQYKALPGVRIEMSDGGYHFLMWDDPEWLAAQVRRFIALE